MTSAALRTVWHPVGYGAELTDAPRTAALLDELIVLWRDGDGVARALRDVCAHRGTALSLGRVHDGTIVCPYHGWRFGPDGRCCHIPQLAGPARVPSRAVVPAYPGAEGHSLGRVGGVCPPYRDHQVSRMLSVTWWFRYVARGATTQPPVFCKLRKP